MQKQNRMTFRLLAAVLAAGALTATADDVKDVLARMDREAAGFHQISARLKKTEFTAVVDDVSVESGRMWLLRKGHAVTMRVEIDVPQPKSVGVVESRAEVYYPKMNTVQIYDLGKAGALVDQFLALGFGSLGSDLQKNYTVKLDGEETINGEKTTRLRLTPRSAKVQEQIKEVELWIPLNAGHAVQQKVTEPGGNYHLFSYAEMKLNPGLPESAFRLKLPPDVKKEYPQK
jgi:outer membrane lipoprotein-sorting protein